ncbi:MAG TPA: extracellular solute-binding protein [Microlunatus sp.]
MGVNRRQFLLGGLAAAATTMGLVGCAPGSSNSGGGGGGGAEGAVDLKFAYWSNELRTKNTTAAIDAYMKANPDVKIAQEPGEFGSYWDKLATQTAGGQSPDVIQMDMNYIGEYGNRQALLDLSKVDTSKFTEGTVDSGRINDQLVGINAGVNSVLFFANPAIFEKAKMDVPDDTTWTWDQQIEIAAEVASKAKVTFGMAMPYNQDGMFGAFLRQNGKELFTPDGLAFEAADAKAWFDLMVKAQKAGAIGSPQQISEEAAKPLDQSALAVGSAAMQVSNTNQLPAYTKAAGTELAMLRFPSLTGKATDRKAWYKASMLWSASAKTKNPDAVVALIDWWVNSPECAAINLAERGVPCNTEILAEITPKLDAVQQTVVKYIQDIKPEVANTPIPPPPGGGTTIQALLLRYETDVLFGKSSTGDAAQKFVDELKSNLQG